MSQHKIVVIGAASASFGLNCLQDMVNTPGLRGVQVVLVDLDEARLAVMTRVAERLNAESGAGLIISSTTERKEALPGATFVVTAIALKRDELWQLDFEIPLKHGVRQVLGENGGPGGLLHTLRNVPVLLGITRDMESLCPNALLINFTNPESRLCMAIHRHSQIRSVGLCHGIQWQQWKLSQVMGIDRDLIQIQAAGVNHFTWIQKMTHAQTGEDLYPRLDAVLAAYDPNYDRLGRYLYKTFGLYPSPSDDHYGEYLSIAWEFCGLHGHDFKGAREHRVHLGERLQRLADGVEPLGDLLKGSSGERAFDIAAAIIHNQPEYEMAVNIPNTKGLIPNLSREAIVEVPATIDGSGIHGMTVEPLPAGIAAMCAREIAVQELAVEAAVTGSRQIALQALLLDPVIDSALTAEKVLDDLLRAHAEFLPQFR